VTVLFADVVRSMDIAAALDVERLREIMTEVVERSAAVAQRYGGTVEYTGDGVMALFGAPIALEDHAFRACVAALAIQNEMKQLAIEVQRRDEVALQVRVGLNSGRVIAGDIGSGSLGYAATGQHVGLAQRMESVAPAGGVMLSESTAQLVEDSVVLSEPQWVPIKGSDDPVRARRLVAIGPRPALIGRTEASLVGRRWEMAALEALLDRTIGGNGGVVNVVGPPGIGKSRVAREAAALAAARGAEVYWTYCESHASNIPFDVVTRLLRTASRVADLDDQSARARAHEQVPDADPQDLLLLDDLLGIADPDVPLPRIDPDARRRRLTALLNSVTLARTEPVLYVIEDTHWIDEVSESMVADLLTVIPRTPAMVLITYRPEYEGALTRTHAAQTIALAPLADSDTAALIGELLGSDPSVGPLAAIIAERAAGNPFFAEEMVRELAQRGVLVGERGGYICRADVAEVSVPATVQAAIAARIDRLTTPARRTLNAASVIGARFGAELLAALGIDAVVDELLSAELIDQVRFTPSAEYAFRHPLIRTVAYESQLKSDRAQVHRRVAAAIESGDPAAAEENAALIAEHLEAAGDGPAAYGWHMRAATWSTNRDISAAQLSWERAQKIADALPAEDPNRAAMRIAPRTMLCGISWRVHTDVAGERFDELRSLCTAVGDKASLAIAMAGLVMDHAFEDRVCEASQLASEAWGVSESLGDPTLTVGLSFPLIYAKAEICEWRDVLVWSQRVIDLADGDPSKGNFILGSPLAVAFTTRAAARYHLPHPGWSDDLRHGLAMARSADPMSFATTVTWGYNPAITLGALRPDDRAMGEIEDAARMAERSADDMALVVARATLGLALVHRHTDAERSRGQKLLAEASDAFPRQGHFLSDLPMVNVYLARERARCGDRDDAIPLMRAAVDHLFREGQMPIWGPAVTGVLVETLLDQGAEGDMAEAEEAIDRLAAAPADDSPAMRDIWLLRLRALLSRACGDEMGYRDYRDRYRAMAESLGFEGHIAWAEAMVEGGE
jgi:class 3 adenylate cyclase